jgi:Papain-like cysteine protease AvrRpt2
MLAYYRRPGPRLGFPEKWIENKGIQLSDFIRLAAAEGLKSIDTPIGVITAAQIEMFLRNFGPIWCAGRCHGVGHIIVLTGVDQTSVYINDPNPYRKARVESLQWFSSIVSEIV